MPPRVSVLIPIYTPGPVLRRCLSSLARQTYPDLEILAIDDAGPEPVQGVIDEFARDDVRWKTVSHERNLGLSASLNDGLRNSTGPFVLVLQQDCEILGERAVEDAVALMEQDGHRCLSGEPVLVLPEMSPTQVAFAAIWNHLPDAGEADLAPVGFSELKCDLFPRVALLTVGAFEERFRISGEDQVLSHRLWSSGWPIVRSTALRFVLRPGRQASIRAYLRKEFLYGRSQLGILLLTTFASVRTTRSALQGRRRLANRLHGLVATLSILAIVGIALAIGPSLWLLLLAVIPGSRMFVVGRRAARVSRRAPRRTRTVTAAVLLTPLDDLVYAAGMAVAVPVFLARRRI